MNKLPAPRASQSGFTLIELMIVVAIIAILTMIAVPSYSAYVFRSRIPTGLSALTAMAARMEQLYQDTGNYGTVSPACGVTSAVTTNFTMTCVLTAAGQGFTATATGIGSVAGATYTIDQSGTRTTVAHPKGLPSPATCWTIGGKRCDG